MKNILLLEQRISNNHKYTLLYSFFFSFGHVVTQISKIHSLAYIRLKKKKKT